MLTCCNDHSNTRLGNPGWEGLQLRGWQRLGVLQGLLQQVLGGNEEVVVTAGRKGPPTNNAFFQLEVRSLPWCRAHMRNPLLMQDLHCQLILHQVAMHGVVLQPAALLGQLALIHPPSAMLAMHYLCA